MKITKSAVAGTLESSDALIRIEPNDSGIDIEINSSVGKQFGDDILATVQAVLLVLCIVLNVVAWDDIRKNKAGWDNDIRSWWIAGAIIAFGSLVIHCTIGIAWWELLFSLEWLSLVK